jgi:PhnB protein
MPVKPVPEGYQSVIPALTIEGAVEAIEFYKRAFGAEERVRMDGPGSTIGHAELEIGDSLLMLADPFPEASTTTPKTSAERPSTCSSTSRTPTRSSSRRSTPARR